MDSARPDARNLSRLPDDVLLHINYFLSIVDDSLDSSLSLQRTCTRLHTLLLAHGHIHSVKIPEPTNASALLNHIDTHPACIKNLSIEAFSSGTLSILEAHLPALLTLPSIHVSAEDNPDYILPLLLRLSNLRSLTLHHCNISTLTLFSALTSLHHFSFELSGYAKPPVTSLQPLSALTALRSASFSCCIAITDFSPLSHSPSLTSLTTDVCRKLDHSTLTSLVHLRALTISRPWGAPLPSLELALSMPHLTSLKCDACLDSLTLHPLIHHTAIAHLDLRFHDPCTFDFAHLTHLTTLRHLALAINSSRPPHPALNPHHLAALTSLTHLALTNCNLPTLAPLSPLTSLNTLHLKTPSSDLTPLSTLASLRALCILYSPQITSLTPLSPLTNLHYLELHGCSAITSLSPLSPLTSLTALNLTTSPALHASLAPLSTLHKLEQLCLASTSASTHDSDSSDDGYRLDNDIDPRPSWWTEPYVDVTPLLDLPALRILTLESVTAFYANNPETRAKYKRVRANLGLMIP